MDENERTRIAVKVMNEYPSYVVGAIIGRAGASEVGLYFGFSRLEDGCNGVALGVALDDEQASRRMNFLHDLPEGALPNWDEHAFTPEYLSPPVGALADDGEAYSLGSEPNSMPGVETV